MNLVLLAAVKLVTVHVLSLAPGEAVATKTPKRLRAETGATLVVAVETADAGKSALFAGAAKVDLGDGKGARTAKPWPAGESLAVEWFKVEATSPYVDNEAGGFHWEKIAYLETAWSGSAGTLSRSADVRPTVLQAAKSNLGTMAFKVRVTAFGQTKATPGAEQVFRGGLGPAVHRVTLRRDDTFLGYLTELYNTPYIWASAGDPGSVHQAERNIGSDCADFMAYGLRRSGKKIEYGSTYDVPAWGGKKSVAAIETRAADGTFVDDEGKAIPVGEKGVRPGDLVLFHRHVGAFFEDRAPLGVLDANDILVHTAWAPPAEESFDQSQKWTSPPFTVWRVK